VPLIFAGPGVSPGPCCRRPVELLDIYPTLIELCGLPAKPELEGHSLAPQLKDADAERPWPAITTHGVGNHAIRSEGWRYIRYADGSQELYDLERDPHEWVNLAGDVRYAGVIQEHARWLPRTDAAPLPGSESRLIEIKDGVVYWENEPIDPDEPIPAE
jgi:arylsulfatase A-like enzyme